MAQLLLTESQTVSYEPDQALVDELTRQLRSRYSERLELANAAGHRAMCIAVDGLDPLATLGRFTEQKVFHTQGGNHPPEVMHEEYGEFEDRSLFLLGVRCKDGAVTSALRIIVGAAAVGPAVKTIADCVLRDQYRAPFLNDDNIIDLRDRPATSRVAGVIGRIPDEDTPDFDRVTLERYHGMAPGSIIVDIATIVVDPAVRAADAGLLWAPLLIAGGLRVARIFGARHAVTVVQESFLRSMRTDYASNWIDLGDLPACQYVEGDKYLSQPAYLDLDGLWAQADGLRIDTLLGRSIKIGKPGQRLGRLMTSPEADSAFAM